MAHPTVIVQGMFGNKEVNRGEFMKQWADHARQLRSISWSIQWQEYASTVCETVLEEAGREFDRLLEQQQNVENPFDL